MSTQDPPVPALPSSSVTPTQELTPSNSNPLHNAPTTDPPPEKKTTSKSKRKETPKKRALKIIGLVAPVNLPLRRRARQIRRPYRKAIPTPEPEGNLPADPKELEILDSTTKTLYKSDREVLEYIESLKHRTAAVLEQVSRTDSQLLSCKGVMARIQSFVGQWEKMGNRLAHQQLFDSENLRAKCEDGVLDSDEASGEEDNDP